MAEEKMEVVRMDILSVPIMKRFVVFARLQFNRKSDGAL